MSLIEAMASSTPVLCTDSCGLADLLLARSAGLVVGTTTDDLVAGIAQHFQDVMSAMIRTKNASELLQGEIAMSRIADDLEAAYTSLLNQAG